MKTIFFIKEEIKKVQTEMDFISDFKIPENKKKFGELKKRVCFLKEVLMYLETNPSEEFIKNQIKKLENRISSIDFSIVKLFKEGTSRKDINNSPHTKKLKKEYNFSTLNKQLNALKYIAN